LETAYLFSFLQFLDSRGAVTDGSFLRAAKTFGIERALVRCFGSDLLGLEIAWWIAMIEQYTGQFLTGSDCAVSFPNLSG
jgi:hypothetical protein